ncbi:MAG: class I SAM-dependent methyltransferase [Cyclobacteriaceae bacterium]|nr:class I SAM-dependent methyltransferase [Cyclobacteriaceae bacterium]
MQRFDRISGSYDFLAKLVFGKNLERAKNVFLDTIDERKNVLIIGGGTGATLEYLDKLSREIKVDYVESSAGMMHKAQQRSLQFVKATFYKEPIEEFNKVGYDVIITEFFFDLFELPKIELLMAHIVAMLKKGGKWIDTDFRPTNSAWHKIVLKSMIMFFKLTVQMSAKELYDTKPLCINYNLNVKREASFVRGFVTSRLFCYD